MRRWLAWPIAVPLAVIGTLSGHAVGYRAAVPEAQARAELLAASGHSYLAYAPLAVALCLALAGLGVFAAFASALSGRRRSQGSGAFKLVAGLAPVAFALQELLERYAHDGHVHWQIVSSAPFLLGLATQVPFALLATAIALALATVAGRVADAIRSSQPHPRVLAIARVSWCRIDLPAEPVLGRGYTGRGPPRLV